MTELSAQFKQVGSNLPLASDTVKHQPWRLIWPTAKQYPTDGAAPAKPKATPRPRQNR